MTGNLKWMATVTGIGLAIGAVLAVVLWQDGDDLKTDRQPPLAIADAEPASPSGEVSEPAAAAEEQARQVDAAAVTSASPAAVKAVSTPKQQAAEALAAEPATKDEAAAAVRESVNKALAKQYGAPQAASKAAKPAPKPWSLAVSTTTSFKPQYTEASGPGRGYSATASGSYRLGSNVSMSVAVPVSATDGEAAEVAVRDPSVTAAVPTVAKLGKSGPRVSASMTVVPGVSKASAEAAKRGAISASMRASQRWGRFSMGLGASASKSFYRWTFSSLGVPNTSNVLTGSGNLGLSLTKALSVSGSLSYSRINRYAGPAAFVFSNSAVVSMSVSKNLSVSGGLSNGGSQLEPDGTRANAFDLYEQDETSAFISASYAL